MWAQLTSLDFSQMSLFEIGMLLCFGASWPAAIIKTYMEKNPKGKSLLFSFLVLIGYTCGCLHKVFFKPDFVFWLYVLNGILVSADIVLVIYYKKMQKTKEAIEKATP